MSSMDKSLKVGVIGCGRVAQARHLPALQSLRHAEVFAVADTDPEQLRIVAENFGIKNRHEDYTALLSDPAIDAVGILVPAMYHVQVAMAALDAGKHVLLEKPLAVSLDEVERLLARAARSPVKAMVGFNLRWHRLVLRAREMIEGGTVGPPHLMMATSTSGAWFHQDAPEWRRRRELGGGVLFEHACHYFDLGRFLLGSEVEEVFAISQSDEGSDAVATVTARMANGVVVACGFSDSTSQVHEIQIYGPTGHIDLSLSRFDGLRLVPRSRLQGDARMRLDEAGHFLGEFPQAVLSATQGPDYDRSFVAQWRHFVNSVKEDSEVGCTLEDGEIALRVALAVIKSASVGEPVRVSEAPQGITPLREPVAGESH